MSALLFSLMLLVALSNNLYIGAHPYADDFPYTGLRPTSISVASPSNIGETKILLSGGASKGAASGDSSNDARNHRKEYAFNEAGSIGSASDAVRFHKLDNQLNGHRVLDASKGSTVDKLNHLAGENFEADKSHNRKHIKSGFSNSYHKDESGSKSSFYEDSDDHGGKQVYDNRHNLHNGYGDKLYTQDRRNEYLRDHYNDRASGSDLHDGHNHLRAGALDRGNTYGHRDNYAHNGHNLRHYDLMAYGGFDYYQPTRNYHHYDDLYRRRSYYSPRPTFATGSMQPAPIMIYEDPRDYAPHPRDPYPIREVRDGSSVLSRDAEYYHDTPSIGQQRRLIYRSTPTPLPQIYDHY
ncbi:uncharacterized protein LOC128728302 [Anopheles nili]|uniref:uncharacterized protein LOC128728302 n=1 Tax=Anopheles nili TaxID=185578 RepID=UPI00237A9DD2|nr:uncharacterized protein LOC128728302 [Anopheles nili]